MKRTLGILFAILTACFANSGGRAQEAIIQLGPDKAAAISTLLMRGSTDIDVFAPILKGFASISPGLRIVYEQRGTNDIYDLAAKACRGGTNNAAGAAGAADLLISSSIDQQVKLVNDGCAQAHDSPQTATLPAWSNWRNEVFGLTYEPAVMVYNRQLIPPGEVPRSRFDLIDLLRSAPGRYGGRVATYDIEQSGLGYLFAFADSQQATTFGRLIEAFGRAGAVATCCSAEVIDAVAEGAYLIAYNMLGSYALARAAKDPRIGIVAPSDYTLILARAALIPRRAANAQAAKRFIDFALSPPGRRMLKKAALIVSFDEAAKAGSKILAGAPANLRPMALSPVQLVGLDRHKRKIFIQLWRSSVNRKTAK